MPRQRSKIPWLKIRDGVYYVYWYDEKATPGPRTKRISLGTTDDVEAQARFAKFLAGGHASFSAGGTAGLKVAAALDDYYREHVQSKVVDKVRAENAIVHLKKWFKDTLVKDIDIPASRAYADARRMGVIGGGKRHKNGEGSDSTIRRELVVLVAAANHARRWKRITPAEMPSLELPAETPQDEEIWLTKAELALALERASGRLKDFIALSYYTAGRRASIERLTRFQVDLRQGRINLTSPNEDANQRRSVKRRPVVPIFPDIRPIVERLLTDNKDSEWLFGDPRDMYRPFREHMEGLNLADKSNPHVLRHSRATHLLHDGVDLWSVAKLLGDTVKTVEKVYGHHCPEHLAMAVKGTS